MAIFVDKSNEKGPKRYIDVKLLNTGQNYAEINPIFQRLSSMIFVRFKFLARSLRAREIFRPRTKSCTIAQQDISRDSEPCSKVVRSYTRFKGYIDVSD